MSGHPPIKLPTQVQAIYRAVEELQTKYPGRKFTPDGHLVGSIGEVIAQEAFGFKLLKMSAPGHDAKCPKRGDVQVKITAGKAISMRQGCHHLIVLKIESPEWASVIYDGPGEPVWKVAGKRQSNGQRSVALSRLVKLADQQKSL